jgi:hypothetical protein
MRTYLRVNLDDLRIDVIIFVIVPALVGERLVTRGPGSFFRVHVHGCMRRVLHPRIEMKVVHDLCSAR